MTANFPRLGERVMRRLDELAADTDEPGKITRLFLSPSHKLAMKRVCGFMEEAGLAVGEDDIGNVVGRLESTAPDAPTFILASHIDSVRDAGRYDGGFGVLSAIELVEEVRRLGVSLPFSLEVVAFGDEEGVRFPATLSGSRALAGTFDFETLDAKDENGISLRQALGDFGCDTQGIGKLARDPARICGYLESHIEQGPVLEAENLALGVVTAIAGMVRFNVEVEGEAGHAGTVPMGRRKDPLAGSAEMILAVEDVARRTSGVVATVGVIEASPGAINVIPAKVRFSVDLRAPADEVREAAKAKLEARLRAIAEERGLALSFTALDEAKATPCDDGLMQELGQALARKGHRVFSLPSGAGHDAMAMAKLCPVAMLFLRCKGGVSHNPAESITVEDAQAAIEVMLDFILHFRPAQGRKGKDSKKRPPGKATTAPAANA
ncbi:MAG: allantoate amidohydrolase [Hyphomicrobiales bacterium]|nr:allantoate amidohydrolase [Hyphomicrobiales bacterium]